MVLEQLEMTFDKKVGRELRNNVNAIRLIMYTLSSISDKCWQCFLAEEDSGQIKQLQLKITDVTSAGSFLAAVWLIGRQLWGPRKWTHTKEHAHTHTRTQPADCQMCHGWGQRRALPTLVRGEGKQLLRADSQRNSPQSSRDEENMDVHYRLTIWSCTQGGRKKLFLTKM